MAEPEPRASAGGPLPLHTIASCIGGYDPDAMSIAQAQAFIARLVPCVQTIEKVALRSALGRVLAVDVVSGFDVPAHDNSAMDGYALRSSDLAAGSAATVLRVAGSMAAGQSAFAGAAPGECVRIMTGAMLPAGLDTVVPQEFVTLSRSGSGSGSDSGSNAGDGSDLGDARHISIPLGAVRPGANRRRAGEDLAVGEVALRAGRALRPADLGLLASLGQAEVPVWRRLRVAFFSTGNELRSIGEPLDPGCVYDSNRYTLWAMLQRLGVEIIDLGVVRDDPAALYAAFRNAARDADAVITSGGVSVGDADHTKQVMASLGEVLFWHIAMRPGRPMAIGRIARRGTGGAAAAASDGDCDGADDNDDAAILFGLPGNPVAVMVTFYALVRDALLAMSGATPQPLPMLRATSVEAIRKRPGRTEYQRGIVSPAPGGAMQVRVTGSQGSGILRSMSEANGLIVLAHEQGDVAAGDWVDVLPFDGLI